MSVTVTHQHNYQRMLTDITPANFSGIQNGNLDICNELMDWFFFDQFVLRNISITEERKLNGLWVGDLPSNIWPNKTQSNIDEKSRLVLQCQIFISECYGESNPWRVVCSSENYISVCIRHDCSWETFKSQLDKVSRGAVLSFEVWTILRNFGLNSSFETMAKDKGSKCVPFGVIGLINHSCQSRFQLSCGKRKKIIGEVIPFSIDYYLREDDENSAIYEGSNQNFVNPTCYGSNEFQILYSENPGFECMCGNISCITNVSLNETSNSTSSQSSAFLTEPSSSGKLLSCSSSFVDDGFDKSDCFSILSSASEGHIVKRKKSGDCMNFASFRPHELILSYQVSTPYFLSHFSMSPLSYNPPFSIPSSSILPFTSLPPTAFLSPSTFPSQTSLRVPSIIPPPFLTPSIQTSLLSFILCIPFLCNDTNKTLPQELMPTNTDRIGVDMSEGSFVKAIDLSIYPERTKVMLKAIIFDMEVVGAHDVHTEAEHRKCYVVFYGAGSPKKHRSLSKSRRIEK